jgi:predicted metal-dependent phosphoesterase TrpH
MTVRRGVIHVHTSHSFDSILPTRAYLAYARRLKLDFICIADHNTLKGARELKRMNGAHPLEVVIGAEYATERGDVVGLFLTEDIEARRFDDIVASIHAQGGLALLPHPYRGHKVDETLYQNVDLVEVFNSRSSREANRVALEDADRLGLRKVAGADTHTVYELLRNRTVVSVEGDGSLRDALADGPLTYRETYTPRNIRRYSQVIKRVRRRVGSPGYR